MGSIVTLSCRITSGLGDVLEFEIRLPVTNAQYLLTDKIKNKCKIVIQMLELLLIVN
jgi:hypothetical protein